MVTVAWTPSGRRKRGEAPTMTEPGAVWRGTAGEGTPLDGFGPL